MIEAEDFRHVEAADVYKQGILAARLSRTGESTHFSYLPDYLAEADLPAVAFSLPKSPEPVVMNAGALPAFFAGLLPEGLRLLAIQTATRTSLDDQLTLLLAVGGETIGDVQLAVAGTELSSAPFLVDESATTGLSFDEVFAGATAPTTVLRDRIALPGIQAKVSAQMMSTPVASGSGPAILKLSPPGLARLVENEQFFLSMATEAGLRVPAHRILYDRDGRSALLVQRFDRVSTRQGFMRLAQEDACQVLGRYPAAKYRISLQEAVRAMAEAVERAGGSGPLVILHALQVAMFSYLIGNGDLHGKNLSIRRAPSGLWECSPGYDLLSTQPYTSFRDPMALPMFGRANRLTRRWWLDAATRLAIPERPIERSLERMSDVGAEWSTRLGEIGLDAGATERLGALMSRRAAELRG